MDQITRAQKQESTKVKTITSMEVARMLGKTHSNILRDIRRQIQYIEQINTAENIQTKIDLNDYFLKNAYTDVTGRKCLCYEVTQRGCDLLAHRYIGVKGTKFSVLYIERFHELQKEKNITSDNNIMIEDWSLKDNEWLQNHERNFRFMCKKLGWKRKKLYHQLLNTLSRKHDIDQYTAIYTADTGHSPRYIMYVVAHFPELRKDADEIIIYQLQNIIRRLRERGEIAENNNM